MNIYNIYIEKNVRAHAYTLKENIYYKIKSL